MKKFVTTHYTLFSDKMQEKSKARFVMLADLHGLVFGEKNILLLQQIRKYSPQAVLIAGDMIVRGDSGSMENSGIFLKQLAQEFPVFLSLGNHEYRLYTSHPYKEQYLQYEKELKEAGVHILHNQLQEFSVGENRFCIYGLEIPMIYYKKPKSPMLTEKVTEELIGKRNPDCINILLAHNPKYAQAYFRWGADLILSGHYHGGMIRLSRHKGLISPQFQLFPPFCCGDFHKGKQHMLVSAGMGEHSIPVRIHNPRELLVIDMQAERTEQT